MKQVILKLHALNVSLIKVRYKNDDLLAYETVIIVQDSFDTFSNSRGMDIDRPGQD